MEADDDGVARVPQLAEARLDVEARGSLDGQDFEFNVPTLVLKERNGGTVIADCVPRMNTYKEPMSILEELFGVKDTTGDRLLSAL